MLCLNILSSCSSLKVNIQIYKTAGKMIVLKYRQSSNSFKPSNAILNVF